MIERSFFCYFFFLWFVLDWKFVIDSDLQGNFHVIMLGIRNMLRILCEEIFCDRGRLLLLEGYFLGSMEEGATLDFQNPMDVALHKFKNPLKNQKFKRISKQFHRLFKIKTDWPREFYLNIPSCLIQFQHKLFG